MTFIEFLQNSPGMRAGLFFCFGLCIGSFATALHWRLPRGLPWVAARSRCPCCGHALGAPDLVPVLSWLFLKGRCRYCHVRIDWRYPATELAFGIVFALISLLL